MSSDESLLTAWNAGAPGAGEELFDRHFVRVVRFFRTKIHGDVDELVQQTFLRCLESRTRFRGEGSFAGFLFGIARNVLLNHYRARQRHGEPVDLDEVSLHDLDPRPSSVVVQRREHQLLLESLRRIPLEAQIILELYYWEDMTSAAIAQALQIPHGTAQTRLRRARQLLAEQLGRARGAAVRDSDVDFDAWARGLCAEIERAGH
jgi:RNA polymerase sigma-70 factor (ECF subfamily)